MNKVIHFGLFESNETNSSSISPNQDDKLKPFNNKNNPKKETLEKLVKETLYNSAAQAILKMIQTPSKVVKLFWFVCLACACCLCTYFVIESLVLFFSYEVSTNTRTYTETSSLFPKVTICNKNVFTTKYAFNLANGSKYDEFIWQINTKLNATQKEKLTHSFEQILLQCLFNAVQCSAQNDFVYEYDKSLGACYTFNSGNDGKDKMLRESIRAGIDFGLTLILYAHFYDRLAKDYNLYSGLIIKIGNSSYTTTSFGIEVASGFNTNILVERYFERTLPRPYSNCDIDNEAASMTDTVMKTDLYNLIWHSELDYSQQLCLDVCQQKIIGQSCNCTTSDKYTLLKQYGQCKSNDPCSINITKLFTIDYIRANCLSLCPLQCNRTLYRTSLSSSLLVGDYFVEIINKSVELREDFFNKKLDSETARNAIVKINIYYETLSYTEAVETASSGSILSLIATIGGILSLFLSVSCLSLFEFIEFAYEIMFITKRDK